MSQKRKKFSEETRRRMSIAAKKRFEDPEELRKHGERSKQHKLEKLKCMRCKQKSPREEVLADRKGYCSECNSHTKLCDCGCGEKIFRYKGRGKIRQYVNLNHADRDLTGPNKRAMCRACRQQFPGQTIKNNSGFCYSCVRHTKLCDCGCGEEMFRYTKQGHVRRYKNYSHKNVGKNNPFHGKKHTEEWVDDHTERTKQWWSNPKNKREIGAKISKTLIELGCSKGEKNPNWRGGISTSPYKNSFNGRLRQKIRRRQNKRCADKDETCSHNHNHRALDCHHIDGDKNNDDPKNLIALCRSHHARARWDNESFSRYTKFNRQFR